MAILNISQLGGFLVDMWVGIINWLATGIPNYAWAIVLLTIAIKLLMSPLDFFNKKVSRKNAQMQSVIQPQLDKLKTQYANDNATYNQKMNELYKANNYNVMGSCLFMLLNLVLTFTIFISLLNGMNAMASTKITGQYDVLRETYNNTLILNNDKTEDEQILFANEAVAVKYDEIKDSWLWIKNVWKSDTLTSPIPSFDEYLKIAKEVSYNGETYQTKNFKKNNPDEFDGLKAEYETIMTPLKDFAGKNNGLFLLVALVVATSILSQWLSTRKLKTKSTNTEDPTQGMNKMMMFLLPVLFGYFALSSTSMFSLYLVVSQLISIMITPLVDLIIDKTQKQEKAKVTAANTPIYSRDNVKGVFEPKETSAKPKNKQTKGKK